MASPTSSPVISSPPFGPTSYSLPFFQPDAVLTHTQLNDWFNFVMAQEQATRTRLLGVGIATGLRVTLSGSTVSISAGCGSRPKATCCAWNPRKPTPATCPIRP